MPRSEAGSTTTEPSTAPSCTSSHCASTNTWSDGPCRNSSDCGGSHSKRGPGSMLHDSKTPGSLPTGTFFRSLPTDLQEPDEPRGSRPVLREPGGAIPPGYSTRHHLERRVRSSNWCDG